MNKTTHVIGGICINTIASVLIINQTNDASCVIPLIAMGTVGGLFPDIDEPNSSMGHKHPVASAITKVTLGHRGAIHTPIVMLIISAIMLFLLQSVLGKTMIVYYIVLGFSLGYLSHLLLDLITPKGIMLLYPVSRKYTHLIGFKSKIRDLLTSLVLICATCLIAYKFIV